MSSTPYFSKPARLRFSFSNFNTFGVSVQPKGVSEKLATSPEEKLLINL